MIFSAYKNRGIFYGCHPQKILLYIIEGLHIPTIGRNKTERNWYNAKIISKAKQICFYGQRISYEKGFIVESQRTPCLYAVPAAWLEIFYRRTCLHQQGERKCHFFCVTGVGAVWLSTAELSKDRRWKNCKRRLHNLRYSNRWIRNVTRRKWWRPELGLHLQLWLPVSRSHSWYSISVIL